MLLSDGSRWVSLSRPIPRRPQVPGASSTDLRYSRAAVPANLWLRSADPAVESHRLRDFDLPSAKGEGGLQPDLVYAGRLWGFASTVFERDKAKTRWLLFRDRGPAEHE
jgi:hypothetical protein